MGRNHDIDVALREAGHVLHRRERPDLLGALQYHHRAGRLALLLPGTYVPVELVEDPRVRAMAIMRWCPDAVLIGATAGQLSFWPELRPRVTEAALPRQPRSLRAGFTFTRRPVPADLVVTRGDLRLSAPALTALDLCATYGGDGIDRALLRRAVTLPQLHAALDTTEHRRGNTDRRRLLLESRDEPWSGAERRAHRLLRQARLSGWRSNFRLQLEMQVFFIDVAFPAARLAIEIDGREIHSSAAAFESDRSRQNLLVLHGWRVLRFTWRMLDEHPEEVVACIRAALAA